MASAKLNYEGTSHDSDPVRAELKVWGTNFTSGAEAQFFRVTLSQR
jgi:hypothetical protein